MFHQNEIVLNISKSKTTPPHRKLFRSREKIWLSLFGFDSVKNQIMQQSISFSYVSTFDKTFLVIMSYWG